MEQAVSACPAPQGGGLAPWAFSHQEDCVQGGDRTLSMGFHAR